MSTWGDQWICECGTHNFFLRPKCRRCGKSIDDRVADVATAELMIRMSRGRPIDEEKHVRFNSGGPSPCCLQDGCALRDLCRMQGICLSSLARR
jgi:hypothetical protein